MTARRIYHFLTLALLYWAQPAIAAEQGAVESNLAMPQTDSVQLGTPVPETTLVSESYSPPKPEEKDIFTEAYDFSKRSGNWIVNGVKDIKLSSDDTQATAAPTVAVQQTTIAAPVTVEQKPSQDTTWDDISDGATRLYDRAIHMFDKDNK